MPNTLDPEFKAIALEVLGKKPWESDLTMTEDGRLRLVPINTENRNALNVGLRSAADTAAKGVLSTGMMAGGAALGLQAAPFVAATGIGAPVAPFMPLIGGVAGLGADVLFNASGRAVDTAKQMWTGKSDAEIAAQEARDKAEHGTAEMIGKGLGMLTVARPSREGAKQILTSGKALLGGAGTAADVGHVLTPAIGAGMVAGEAIQHPKEFDPTTGEGLGNIGLGILGATSTKLGPSGRVGQGTVEALAARYLPKAQVPPSTPSGEDPAIANAVRRFDPNAPADLEIIPPERQLGDATMGILKPRLPRETRLERLLPEAIPQTADPVLEQAVKDQAELRPPGETPAEQPAQAAPTAVPISDPQLVTPTTPADLTKLTRAQKAAATRAKNKAAREAAAQANEPEADLSKLATQDLSAHADALQTQIEALNAEANSYADSGMSGGKMPPAQAKVVEGKIAQVQDQLGKVRAELAKRPGVAQMAAPRQPSRTAEVGSVPEQPPATPPTPPVAPPTPQPPAAPRETFQEVDHLPLSHTAKVAKLPYEGAPELAQRLVHAERGREQMQAQWFGAEEKAILALDPAAVKEADAAMIEATKAGNIHQPLAFTNPEAQRAYELMQAGLAKARAEANQIGVPAGRREIGQNINYMPESIKPELMSALTDTRPGSLYDQMRTKFLQENADIAQKRGEQFNYDEAKEYYEKYIRAALTGEGVGEFNPLTEQARRYHWPQEMLDPNPVQRLNRYMERAARDLARVKYIESDPRSAALLGVHMPDAPPMQESRDPALRFAHDQIYGVSKDQSTMSKLTRAVQEVVYGGLMQSGTGINNYISGIARAIVTDPHNGLGHIIRGHINAVKDFATMEERALRAAATRARPADIQFPEQYSDGLTQIRVWATNVRNTLSKYTWGNKLENAGRVRDYALGELIGTKAVQTGDKAVIRKFGDGIGSNDSPEVVIQKIAGNFVRAQQTSYSMRGLPKILLDNSTTAQILRLKRYGFEASTRVYNDVVVPLKQGNAVPFLMYTAASMGLYYAKQKKNELLSGSKGSEISPSETRELTNGNDLEMALSVMEAMDNAEYFGLAGQLVSAAAASVRGKRHQVLSEPAIAFIFNGIVQNAVNAVNNAKDGTPFGQILIDSFKKATIDQIQDARVIESLLKSNDERALQAGMQTRRAAESVSPYIDKAQTWGQNFMELLPFSQTSHLLRDGLMRGEPAAFDQLRKLALTDPLRAQRVQQQLRPQEPFYAGDAPLAAAKNASLMQLLQRRGQLQPVLDAVQNRATGMSNAAQQLRR